MQRPQQQARSPWRAGPLALLLAATAGLLAEAASAQSNCIQFARFTSTGFLPVITAPVPVLHEVSGLEASRTNPGILWAHDDANNSNQVVAITRAGKLVQSYLVGTLANGDWEDIAIGPGPEKGRDYIYLADIGNNNLNATVFALIRFPEPAMPATPSASPLPIANPEVFSFRYPTQTHDAETLLIDPVDGTPYILTKEARSSGTGYLYRYPLPLDPTNVKTLVLERQFNHANPKFSAGDVTQDGRWIVVRNDVLFYTYPRGAASSPFGDAFTRTPCVFDASNQGNAESLAVITDATGTRVYCTSEGAASPIYESIGTLPAAVPAPASWWNFGSGVASPQWGPAGLTLDEVPGLGRTVSMHVLDARPISVAAVGIGLSAIPDGQVPFAGGWAHVSPALVFINVTGLAGEVSLPLGAVPNQASLLGARLHAQVAIDDSTAPGGLGLSRGLSLLVGL